MTRAGAPSADLDVALVSPEFPFSGRVPLVPPILEYLGALTRREMPEARLRLVDANVTPVRAEDLDADLVGVSVWTATAPWAYRFADACRAAGKRVVLGGIHATALPAEAAAHADAVVVGEAESVWGEVLRDARAGRLRPRYDGARLPLAGLPVPIDGKLPGNYQFRAFFTMRGCPHACTFCSVHCFFGRAVRYRPVDEVAREIEERAGRIWFNGDDNIWGADPDRAIALFDRLAAGTRRRWYGFGDLRSIQGPDGERMLAAACRSGLFSVWAGWESDSGATLRGFRADGKQGKDRLEAIRRMQGHGLDVVLFVMLGGRDQDAASFERTLELSDRLGVNVHPVLVTPLPGTPLHDEYAPHLLPGLGWEAYTGVRAVFAHPAADMAPLRREALYHDLCREVFRPGRIARRLRRISRAGFPATHLLSLMMQIPMRRALGKARRAWEAEAGAPAEALAHPDRPPRAAEAGARGKAAHDVALGAWLAALAMHAIFEVAHRQPGWGAVSDQVDRLETQFMAVAWAAVAAVLVTGTVRWVARRAARSSAARAATARVRSATYAFRGALAAAAAALHGFLALAE